ncbi:MAG: hypothetical protein ABIP64_11170 [Burkholderiales bacterium]
MHPQPRLPNITDERIGNLLASVPPRSVILLEDIDAPAIRSGRGDFPMEFEPISMLLSGQSLGEH